MKISNIYLENIKCFKKINISFEDENSHLIKNWTLIAGNNGEGKTTLLRSLAIGLCDQEGASALLVQLHGDFVRDGEQKGIIRISLKNSNQEKYIIETEIERTKDKRESLKQKIIDNKQLKRKDIFAVGYGVGRTISGTYSYEEYVTVDSLFNLFDYEAPLQNIELVMSRIKLKSKDQWKILIKKLKNILMLDSNDDIRLDDGLYIKGKRWGDISFGSLSDGYQSLTSVILDFIGWDLINNKNFSMDDIHGIMIIDEIEQHLHPKWQREIIKSLANNFPKVQFICSTHAPICVLGLNDLEDTPSSQLLKTYPQNNHTEVDIFDLKKTYNGYRADQILTSEIFDLSDTRSTNIEKKLDRYRDLYLKEKKERTKQENKEFEEIKKELRKLPMWDKIEDKKQREELIKLLKEKKP